LGIMVTLSDFNKTEKPTLAELSPAPQVTQVVNGDTISNMAAHAALLADPSGVLKTYSAVSAELSTGTESSTLEALLKQNRETEQAADYAELQKILRDPQINTAEKQSYMDGYINSVAIPKDRSLSTLISQKAATQPSSEFENDETLETVVLDRTIEDNVDAYRGWANQIINTQRQIVEGDGVGTFIDILEGMVPFLDQAGVAKARLEAGGSVGDAMKALTLVGDSKAEMAAAIAKMPVEARYELAQKVVDAIKNSTGSVTIRPNQLSMFN
jgi:hypothetical protein